MTKKEPKIEDIMTKHHKTDFKTNYGFFRFFFGKLDSAPFVSTIIYGL